MVEDEIHEVIIADDDQDDFELLSEAISDLSLKIVIKRAENGEVLLKVLREKIPNLLFLDIHMPCKDGRDCIREIRTNEKFDNLPIIIYTGSKDYHTIEYCFVNKTDLFVNKPHNYSQITEIVKKIFSPLWKSKRFPQREEYVLTLRD